MTPPWLRLLDPSYRLTLALNDSPAEDAQRNAQRRRRAVPVPPNPFERMPAPTGSAPAPEAPPSPAPSTNPVNNSATGTQHSVTDTQTCNGTLHRDSAHPENNRFNPRDSFRLCGVSIDDHFLVNGLGTMTARAINLPDFILGPEYPNDVGVRLDFALPRTTLLGFGRFSTGPFNTDAAPNREGWTNRLDFGVRNYGRSPYRGGFGSGGNELGIGFGFSSLDGVEGSAPRFFYFNRSDLISYSHRVANFSVRASMSVFQGEGSISLGSGPVIPGRGGMYNHLGDIFPFSNFIPLRLSLSFFWNPPANSSDAQETAPGTRASLSNEDIATRVTGRVMNELINFRRRESNFVFAGTQLSSGIQGNPALYGLAGTGQGFMGLVEGWSRGSDAFAMGDLARHEANGNGRLGIIGAEAGLALIYFAVSAASPSLSTTDRAEGDRVMTESGFGAVRTGRWLQLGQAGLTALDAFGLTGNPEEAGVLFHASNGIATGLGLVFLLVPRAITGNGYVNNAGLLDNSLFADSGPFFDGTRGTVRRTDFIARREGMYAVHATGVMSLSYALSRTMTWLGYAIDRGLSRQNQNPGNNSSSNPRQLNLSFQLLQGGGMFTAGGTL